MSPARSGGPRHCRARGLSFIGVHESICTKQGKGLQDVVKAVVSKAPPREIAKKRRVLIRLKKPRPSFTTVVSK